MWSARNVIHDEFMRLPLTAVHPDLERDSDLNQKWNLFTLVLLARCGAITWDFHIDQDDNAGWITIRVNKAPATLNTEPYWHEVVEPVRRQLVSNSSKNLERLMNTLSGEVCTGVQIAGSYQIREPPRLAVTSGVACGGCIACRQVGRQPYQDDSPVPATATSHQPHHEPPRPWAPAHPCPGRLYDLSAEGRFGRVLTIGLGQPVAQFSQQQRRGLLEFLRASGGIQMFVAPAQILEEFSDVLAGRHPAEVLMLEDLAEWDPDLSPDRCTAVFLDDCDGSNEKSPWFHGHTRIPLIIRLTREENPEVDGGYALGQLTD
jgi:hypothetical protein